MALIDKETSDPDLVKLILGSGSFSSFGFSPTFGLLGAMLMSKKKTNEMKTDIEIPFGAKDSELKGWEYTIPEGMEAVIKDGKVIVRDKEREDERIRKAALEGIEYLEQKLGWDAIGDIDILDVKEYLEKQKEQKPMESWPNLSNCKKDCKVCFAKCLYRKEENIEQKPADWSEEDEKMNKEIRLYLKQDRTDFPGRAERINKMIEWLINICPNSQWKPSKEQMGAFAEALARLMSQDIDNRTYANLCELKSDLKKLM